MKKFHILGLLTLLFLGGAITNDSYGAGKALHHGTCDIVTPRLHTSFLQIVYDKGFHQSTGTLRVGDLELFVSLDEHDEYCWATAGIAQLVSSNPEKYEFLWRESKRWTGCSSAMTYVFEAMPNCERN